MKARKMILTTRLLLSTALVAACAAPAMATEITDVTEVQPTASLISTLNTDIVNETEELGEIAQAVKESAASNESECANIGIAQVDNYVNVRESASKDSEIVGIMENGAIGTIVGEEDGWYQIESGDIQGYVKADYIVVGDEDLYAAAKKTIAEVNTSALKVRSDASTDASVLKTVTSGTKLDVIDASDDEWIAVTTASGDGYVAAEYVEVSEGYTYAIDIEDVTFASTGSSVANFALQFVGNPYRWGGTSLTNGADCSGFIMAVYANYGVSLPHSSSALRSVGRAVSYSEAQPGDIICYSGHVALYIGNGQIVHASTPSGGIKVSSATFKSIVAVRRIF